METKMELARIFHGKKYMWDGKTYSNRKEFEETSQQYRNDRFEVATLVENGQY